MITKPPVAAVCALLFLVLSAVPSSADATNEFIFIGNSVSYGNDASNVSYGQVSDSNTNAEGVVQNDLGPTWQGLDLAVPGASTQEMISTWNGSNPPSTSQQNLFAAGVTNKVVIPWEASNALNNMDTGTDTAAQIEANAEYIYGLTVNFSLQLQSQGDTVLALTILPRDQPGMTAAQATEQEEARQDFNTLVKDGWQSWASALVDVGDDPTIGQYSDLTNGTYWYDPGTGSDQYLHLTDAGYAIVGNDVADAIENLQAAPEPSICWMVVAGLAGLAVSAGRFRSRKIRC